MKNSMMKFVSILLMLTMVLSITGCGSKEENAGTTEQTNAETEESMVIGVSMQGNTSGFIQYITSGIWEHQANDAKDVEVKVMFADDDAAKQLSQIETFISNKVDAIIINPVDTVQGATAVDLAFEAGIPIITVNTTTSSENNAAHVGSDDIEAGIMQMKRAIEVVGEDAKVAYVDAVLGHSAQVGRSQGYEKALGEYPNVELVVHDTGNWSGDESMKLVENWLQAGKEMDAILCMADCQLTGVITAIEGADKVSEIKLLGMDCDPVIMKAIEEGVVDSSIWQDGVGQGREALKLAIEAAKGNEIQDKFIPYEICNGDNIDEFMKRAEERNTLARKYF